MYCVYLTTYRGSLLPPFYIGCTSLLKINEGYRGTVTSKKYKKRWLHELKRSPHLFKTTIIKTFNDHNDAFDYEHALLKRFDVYRNEMYINACSASGKGTIKKKSGTSKAVKQRHKDNPNIAKNLVKSNKTEENIAKVSRKMSSYIHVNNGVDSRRVHPDIWPYLEKLGWVKGRITFSRISTHYMHKDGNTIRAKIDDVPALLQNGYEFGYDNALLEKKKDVMKKVVVNRKNVKRMWINDGNIESLHAADDPVPTGFSPGRLRLTPL